METTSVEAVCNLLGRSRLLPPEEVRALLEAVTCFTGPAEQADDLSLVVVRRQS